MHDVQKYINGFLFANEFGDLSRLLSYQVKMPVSLSTTLAWMKALGCTHERHQKTYYTDTHENPKVVKYRGEYIEEKRKHALRQALWVRVRRADLSEAEVKRLDGMKADSPEGDFYAEVYDCVLDVEDYIEIHVDSCQTTAPSRPSTLSVGHLVRRADAVNATGRCATPGRTRASTRRMHARGRSGLFEGCAGCERERRARGKWCLRGRTGGTASACP